MNVLVPMPSGPPFRLKQLLSTANYKQKKGVGYLSTGLTLTPRDTSQEGFNACPHATAGCAASCFAGYDRMNWWKNKRVAVARTLLLANDRERFLQMLLRDLHRLSSVARRRQIQAVCRLNVVSDYPFERMMPTIFQTFPDIQFMDYTKNPQRVLRRDRPVNYHLTFSRSERNEAECLRVLSAGHNVTVVFRQPPFPLHFWGYRVIDGDVNDLRFLDPSPCVVGLKAKGKGARDDQSGFVLDSRLPLPVIMQSK